MLELLSAINAARRDGFTIALHFSAVEKAGKCEVSVLTPCYAHRDFRCEHLCSLLSCTVEEATALITRLTDFPC